MTAGRGTVIRSYLTLVVVAVASAMVLMGLGYVPTSRVAGRDGVAAMVVGCVISWIAGCVGAIPVARAIGGRSRSAVNAILTATSIRFGAALVLVVPAALSGLVERKGLVLWVGISYVSMLGVDTLLAVRMLNHPNGGKP